MKYKNQEQIPYDYVWQQITTQLSKGEVDSYNQYTNDFNNAKSDDAKEFFLEQRHKYLTYRLDEYLKLNKNTNDKKYIFNHDIAKNILAEPHTNDASVFYTSETVDVISPTLKICKSEAYDRYLLYRNEKPVSAIVILRKNDFFGAKENTITTIYTLPEYQKQGLSKSLIKIVQKRFGNNLVPSDDLKGYGFKLPKIVKQIIL